MVDARRITVVGSANIDLVTRVQQLPAAGEVTICQSMQILPGGKGANQAVAVSRSGGRVSLVAKVGDDAFGQQVLDNLLSYGVDISLVSKTKEAMTGTAIIIVDAVGENRIVVTKGANQYLNLEDIEKAQKLLAKSSVLLLNLEIDLSIVAQTVDIATKANVPVVLDPAPAQKGLPLEILEKVDFITPNQQEASVLTGIDVYNVDQAEAVGVRLLQMGVRRAAIIKLGADGVVLVQPGQKALHFRGHKVDVVDTTGAGDTFAGGLTVALSEGLSLPAAVAFANAAGALAVTELGAQGSIPCRERIMSFLSEETAV